MKSPDEKQVPKGKLKTLKSVVAGKERGTSKGSPGKKVKKVFFPAQGNETEQDRSGRPGP